MSRTIKTIEHEGEKITVTPEAINKFPVAPFPLNWIAGADDPVDLYWIDFKVRASCGKKSPVKITGTCEIAGKIRTFCQEIDEDVFADEMIEAIVVNFGNIDDVPSLWEAKQKLFEQFANILWEAERAVYTGLRIPGFGYIEANGEVVATADCLYYQSSDNIYADECTRLFPFGSLGKGRFHFLPGGETHFLVFDLEIADNLQPTGLTDESRFLLDNKTKLPVPSKEVSLGDIPGPRASYQSLDDYLEVIDKYIQKHMKASNDKRVELEDDLIF